MENFSNEQYVEQLNIDQINEETSSEDWWGKTS